MNCFVRSCRLGVHVPDGFAVTADGYRHFLEANGLAAPIGDALRGIRKGDVTDLVRRSDRIRDLMTRAALPGDLEREISASYEALARSAGASTLDVAVRSSATAEDLPNASFAGQQETFLNVRGAAAVVRRRSQGVRFPLYAARDQLPRGHGLRPHEGRALGGRAAHGAVGPRERRRDLHARHRHRTSQGVVLVTSSFGLGESVVQGQVAPDQFIVHKDRLARRFPTRSCGGGSARRRAASCTTRAATAA